MSSVEDKRIVLISMLEHYVYCPRQCALIHLEQTFDENVYTIRGSLLHETVDEESSTREDRVRVERGLPLWSEQLGLRGKADVVEFREEVPYPVEYKLGKRREREAVDVQLCAQAICLEEMLGVEVPAGAVFHKGSQRRREVLFNPALRKKVEDTVSKVRTLLEDMRLPTAVNDARCRDCSLKEACMHEIVDEPEKFRQSSRRLFELTET